VATNFNKMEKVDKLRVNKQKLIDVLEKNKKEHIKTYDLAMIGYKINIENAYKDKLNQFKKLKGDEFLKFNININVTMPTSHEDDFDIVIGMLSVSEDNEVYITENQYREYYLNQWSWYRGWSISNSGNVGIGTSSPEGQLYLSHT